MADQADPAKLLELILGRAVELRQAGVLELDLAGMRVRFSPAEPKADADDQTKPAEPVLTQDDPATYGLPPGSPVPGFAALRERRERGKT